MKNAPSRPFVKGIKIVHFFELGFMEEEDEEEKMETSTNMVPCSLDIKEGGDTLHKTLLFTQRSKG